MKTDIKNRIEEIITGHKAANVPIIEQITAWEKTTMYSDSYKQEQIKTLKTKIMANDANANDQIKVAIAEARDFVIGSPTNKPADYSLQISNALEFIKLAGKSLTDDQAAGILKPFRADGETMTLFESVISNLTEGTGLSRRFEKTFGETNAIIALSNNFAAVEALADTLINSGDSGLAQGITYGLFMGNIDAIQDRCEQL